MYEFSKGDFWYGIMTHLPPEILYYLLHKTGINVNQERERLSGK